MSKLTLSAIAFSAALAASGAVLGEDSVLTLVVGGEAYDGAPRFEVSFDGHVLGEGVVDAAIDTATSGRFAKANIKLPYIQNFEFKIPEDHFRPDGEVRLRFLNEAYGGDGSDRDRNLFVFSVAVNGKEVPGAQLTTMSAAGIEPNVVLGDFLVLPDGTADAISTAPDNGWPIPGTPVAAATVAEPAPAQDAPAESTAEAPTAPPAGIVLPKADEADVELAAAPAAKPAATSDPVTTASIAPPTVEADDPCGLDQLYNVIGFNENSNDLTPRLQERLDQIIADIGERECVVQVVGYSSTVGDYATNALFAVERAQNVLRYLRENGLRVAEATATGAGETEQFGTDPLKNRRVVITVSP